MASNTDTEWGQAVMPVPHSTPDGDCTEEKEEEILEVAVIGGGLAGLATAIGLHRAGIPFKVYERASRLRSNSQGILAVQPNGMSALEKIHPDLPRLIVEAGCERKQLAFTKLEADGTVEETLRESGQESLEKYGRLKVGLTWHKMQQILASLLPPEVVITSRSLVSFEEDQDGVMLHFEDIHSDKEHPVRHKVRAKVAIACDGVFSVARRQMFQEDPPLYFGQLNWATVIETDKLPPNVHPPNAVHYFMHHGEPRWMSMLNDGGGGETFWQFRVADPEMALSLSANKGRGGLGLEGVKKSLLPVAKPCELVFKAIECIPESQIFERSIVGRLPASTWLSPRGRLVLVGDSAHGMHPNIGQGFNSAAESSSALLEAMVQAYQRCDAKLDDVNWCAALKAFEDHRKPRADVVQRYANMMGCNQATGVTVLPKDAMNEILDWIVGGDADNFPPQETLDVIFAFDPLKQKGVSRVT